MKSILPPPSNRVKLLLLLIVFVFATLPLQTVWAQGPTDGVIPAGETRQGSVFLSAPQVRIEGTVDGDVFAISPDVVVSGEIKGDLFVLSRIALIDGILDGNLYAANSRLTLGSAARVARNVYAASVLMTLTKDSEVGDDLYLVALGSELSGSVGRDQRAYVGLLEILVLLFGESDLLRSILPPDFQFPSRGATNLLTGIAETVLYKTPAPYMLASGAGITLAAFQVDDSALANWLSGQWQTFAPMLLVGLLLVWLFPRFLQGSTEQLRSRPGNSFVSGIMIFFVCIGAALLALLLVLALGMFFSTMRLTGLTWTIWMAGFGGLSLALAALYVSVDYLSKVIVAYLVGMVLLGRIPPAVWGRRVWMLLLGEVIVLLLLSIPTLGWVLSVLITMFGLGTIYLYFRQNLRSSGQTKRELPVATSGELIEHEEVAATTLETQPAESPDPSMQPLEEIVQSPGASHGRKRVRSSVPEDTTPP